MAKNTKTEDKRKEPRFYMKLAIDAMKKSVDELNNEAPSPRAGAVAKLHGHFSNTES